VPGLTGLWQVSGKNKTTFVEMIQLDVKYAKNKTLWWDLKIILMTVPALVIQMLETRRAGKASSRPICRKTSYSNRAIEQYSFTKTALVSAVQARDGEVAWIRKESKLNLYYDKTNKSRCGRLRLLGPQFDPQFQVASRLQHEDDV
jgi:hypothetical protein